MDRSRQLWRGARSRPIRLLYVTLSVLFVCLWLFGTATAEPLRDLGVGVKPDDPESIPADGKSKTHLLVDINRCSWVGSASSDGTFQLQVSTTLGSISPGFASNLDSGPFPPELTLTAGTTVGTAKIEAKLDYCPPGGVMAFGVCTDPTSQGMYPTCVGTAQVEILPYTAPESAESGEKDEQEDEEESKEFSAGVTCSPPSPTVGQTITCTVSVKNAAEGEDLKYTWYVGNLDGVTTSKPTHSWPAKESGGHTVVVEVLGDNRWTRASLDFDVLGKDEKPVESDTGEEAEQSVDDLVKNLQDWLSAGGIKEPDPAKVVAGGGAAAVLIATWFIINNRSGVPMEKLEMALGRWRWSQRGGPAVAPGERPSDVPEGEKIPPKGKKPGSLPEDDKIKPGAGAKAKVPPADQKEGKAGAGAAAQAAPPAEATPARPPVKPAAGESGEEQALRHVRDMQDLDDAVDRTNKGLKEFIDKIPEALRNSEKWKNLVAPKLQKLQDLLSKIKLDKGRTWLDRAEKLLELRKEAERDLAHLQPDAREAVIWTERTLRVLSNIATDAFKTMVTDRAKDAGNAILPKQAAEKWAKAMDELHKEMEGLGEGIALAVRRGAFNVTRGKSFGEAVDEAKRSSSPEIRREAQDLENFRSGPREVPVEYPRFMERGTKKVNDLWTRFKNSLPPAPPIKKWLGW